MGSVIGTIQMKRLISIIIPHYNSENGLKKLIDSIPKDERVEVIVVDDCSLTEEQLESLRLSYQWVIFKANDTNLGAGAARNVGLKVATGKWLMFADADDYFVPGAFDEVFKHIDDEEDMVFFRSESINLSTGEPHTRHQVFDDYVMNYYTEPSEINELKLRSLYFVPWAKMVRKSLVDENSIKFMETNVANDMYFSVKAATLAKKLKAVDKVIYCVTYQQGTLTTTINKKNIKTRAEQTEKVFALIKKIASKEQIRSMRLTAIDRMGLAYARGYGIGMAIWTGGQSIKAGMPIFPENFCKRIIGYLKR